MQEVNTVFYDPLYGFYTYDTDPETARRSSETALRRLPLQGPERDQSASLLSHTGGNEEQRRAVPQAGHESGFEQKWMGEIIRRAVTGGTEASTADPANEPALYTFYPELCIPDGRHQSL